MTDNPDPKPALWLRMLRLPPVRLVTLGGGLFYMLMVNNTFMTWFAATPLASTAVTVAMTGLALAIYVGFVRFIEGRPVRELSLPGMGRELGIGAAIGAGLYTICVLILMALGIYRIEGLNPVSFMLPAVAMALNAGIFEELVFRGALFRIVEEMFGSWISLAVSSFVFGFIHMLNPAGTLMGAIFISIEAGLLLAAAYMLTRRLWMSIGFHMAWNYTQSAVFSGVVSGGDKDPGLIKSAIVGPAALTGGSFGLESSLIAFLLCTGTGVVLLVIAVRRGHVMPPFWQRVT